MQARRCCVYTSLYGNLDELPDQPVRAASNLDFIAFVGDPGLVSGSWTLRHLPPRLPGDPVRSARFAKMHPHLLLGDYDASLYIDCTVLLKEPPEALFDALLFGRGDTMACLQNSHRDNVPDEALAIVELGYDDPETLLRQLRAYADAGYRGTVPLVWTGLLLRFHHHTQVVTMMERWWEHILRYSRRDQLSFCYVAEILDFPFVAHALDNESSRWHRWPLSRTRVRAPWAQPPPAPPGEAPSPFQLRLQHAIDRLAAVAAQVTTPLDDAQLKLFVLQAERDRLERETGRHDPEHELEADHANPVDLGHGSRPAAEVRVNMAAPSEVGYGDVIGGLVERVLRGRGRGIGRFGAGARAAG